jgi:GntR family transcriptional regulator
LPATKDIHTKGGRFLEIIISNSSDKPIYEQITSQIKNMIITEELKHGEALPSMRFLAKELRISVITTKRAYEELERDGFIETVPGKGSYVAAKNTDFIREEQLRVVEMDLQRASEAAKMAGITLQELIEILTMLYLEEQ